MTKLYVVSKSDLKKLASGRSSGNRSFAVSNGEELDLDKRASGHSSIHLIFAMLYLGLFIGFLITTIAVDMPTNKHTVFIAGTILFGAVSLFLLIWWWIATKVNVLLKGIKKWPTYEDTVQID